MLLELNVKDIALIRRASVEFSQGLNILTGETGAGKSIVIGSIGLVLGAKAKSDIIREGADHASIELIISADDPEHYLRRNYDDTWRMAGSLFFQYDCMLDSHNLVIFGHNMSDGSMFACLHKMFDAEFREEHSQIILHTADSTRYFRVVSVMKTDLTQLPFNRTVFQSEKDFITFAEQMLQDTDTIPNSNLTLLTLITCAYDWEGARTVVVAVETNEW